MKKQTHQAIAEFINGCSPSNILYLFGKSGVGKTHLIKQVLSESNRYKNRVKFLATDNFLISVINAIKDNSLELLKNKLSRNQLLIIEDIDTYSFRQHSNIAFLKAVEKLCLHLTENNHHLVAILNTLKLFYQLTHSPITSSTLVFWPQTTGIFICTEELKVYIGSKG